MIDPHSLEILEFDKIRGLVASYAACSLGKAAAMGLTPLEDLETIRRRQALTTEMAEAIASGLTPPFGGLRDVRAPIRRAMTGATLTADDLCEVAETLRAVGQLDQWLAKIGDQFPRLGGLREGVGEFTGVVVAIEGCLDNRGQVLDTASRRLSNLRREIHQVEEAIQEQLRRMIRSPELRKILRYPNFTMVGHHYVLPVAKEHRGELLGSVHRSSASNETVFIEPQAIAEKSAHLAFLRAREAKEIQRILRFLSAQVGQVGDALLSTLENLGELDLIHAQGRYSLDFRMAPPDFNTHGRLVLNNARHPLLEDLFRRHPYEPPPRALEVSAPLSVSDSGPETATAAVSAPSAEAGGGHPAPVVERPRRVVTPINLHLGFQFSILVITGPNTGGKTVALKTVALLAAMAQCGLHIPAGQGSQLPVFDDILADIGDEQSLEQSLSTFSSHIRRIRTILSRATPRSLVILDELGAGTDPTEGAALGRAILDELDSIGCLAIVTTHIGDLKTYAFTNPRVENAAVEFDLETLRPMYHLTIGDIGQSNALQIARRLDLPGHVVDRAARYLEQGRGPELPEWDLIQALRKEAEEARKAALEAQAEAERRREALDRKLDDVRRQTENEAKLADARARLQPGDRVVVERFGYDRPGRVVKLDHRKKQAQVMIGQVKWDVPINELIPQLARTPDVPDDSKKKGRIDYAGLDRP